MSMNMSLADLLVHLTGFSRRHALAVTLATLLLAGLAAGWSATHLGVSTDTDAMFSPSLPWRQRQIAQDRDFPQFRDLLLAVVQSDTPEAADATAAGLVTALVNNPHIASIRRPDTDPYLAHAGLMFLDPKQLASLLEQTIDAQPFLGQLAADPSARGLFAALALLGMGVAQGQAELEPYLPALGAFHRTMASAVAGKPEPLSWTRLLGGQLAELAGPHRIVLIQPRLDYGVLEPGSAATHTVRAAIAAQEFVKSGHATVHLTGPVALADEEFATVAEGAVTGLIGSVLLVTLWLFLAVWSWRLIVPILLTLFVGLAFTLFFAAAAVGTLNLVSVGFGILFIGLAVDFAIQFAVRYREARGAFADPAIAMTALARRAGTQILLAAAAIAAGFLAFVPTDFAGVAELGLIAGVGMLIAFACTLGFLPAAITLFRATSGGAETALPGGARLDALLTRHRYPLLAGFAVAAMAGAALIPRIGFDTDPLNTKDPSTEAMRTLRALADNPVTPLFSIDIMAPSVDAAVALATRLRALPQVADVVTLDSLVPTEQAEKRTLIADAAAILGPSLVLRAAAAPVTANDLRLAAQTAYGPMAQAVAKSPAGQPVTAALTDLATDLRALANGTDTIVLAADAALTRYLPAQLAALRVALAAPAVSRADIPASLARDWITPDGRARIQVTARVPSRDSAGLLAFVTAVRAVAPEAGGPAAAVTASAATITGAFRAASFWALGAITLLLALALRRVLDVALVLAPLLLSALLTALVAVLAGLQLNYANIIALPLLLGVGVSFNVYFVLNWRAGVHGVLGTATARAVLFSALTTASAFGTLAASHHPGTASMGVLLLISLGATLLASLVFIPALLACLTPPPLASPATLPRSGIASRTGSMPH